MRHVPQDEKGGIFVEKIRKLIHQYRELLSYLVFGVLTTVVNYVVYLLAAPFFETATVPTAIAWIFAVVFAYVTNRKYVFRSKASGTAVRLLLRIGTPPQTSPQENLKNLLKFGSQFDNIEIK